MKTGLLISYMLRRTRTLLSEVPSGRRYNKYASSLLSLSAVVVKPSKTVRLLLDNAADCNTVFWPALTSLHCAVRGQYWEVVKTLLEGPVEVKYQIGKRGWTLSHRAVKTGQRMVVKMLLAKCVVVTLQEDYNKPAAQTAAEAEDERIMDLIWAAQTIKQSG